MITEHTHAENNDWQGPGGEQPSASEIPNSSPAMDAPAPEDRQAPATEERTEEPATPAEEGASPVNGEEQAAHSEAEQTPATSAEQEVQSEAPAQPAVAEEHPSDASGEVSPAPEGEQVASFENPVAQEETSHLPNAEFTHPFTSFIEEFRQTEERFGTLLGEPENSFTAFVAGSESLHEPVVFLETAPEDLLHVVDKVAADLRNGELAEKTTEESNGAAPAGQVEDNSAAPAQPKPPLERPVSPLLRPATRLRLPRHGRHRIEEVVPPVEEPKVEETKAAAESPVAEVPATEEAKPEEPPVRPARRYRFDRPAATASATPATSVTPTPSAPARGTETRGKRGVTSSENGTGPEVAAARAGTTLPAVPEAPAQKVSAQETAPASNETSAPAAPERRRRGSHDRQREKEQAAATPIAPTPEPVVPEIEPAPAPVQEVPVEDLPPLEYSELQAASSRRRRRRRVGGVSTAATNGVVAPKAPLQDIVAPTPPPAAPAQPKSAAAPILPPYNIVSGYTLNQMNQGDAVAGPFMGPEPAPARGSTFSTSGVRPMRGESLRNTPVHPAKHSEGPTMSTAAVNHLANVVSQAMQIQTDRMVAEMRRANQSPTNVSVSLPPFPSTERVGVFVDVANLLYSARTLRMTVDFGKLLDFLRGNRRLVRAQAYCPTSPQPGDDQMFLQAVKGLGYRITTKNYKTFSSGAKKADLDLDLCMDVVRLVDGKAVDCIVLVSGDSDFMPMLDYCSDHGVRVEIAAFDESMSATLRQACDLFVNLSMLEEIRA